MNKTTILIVDDETPIREIIACFLARRWRKRTLETTEVEVLNLEGAKSGKEAISLISNSKSIPNLVITDNEMPEMSGVELIDWIKENYPQIPVILMSGGTEPPNHQADVFLKKPPILKNLIEIIEKLLKEARLAR